MLLLLVDMASQRLDDPAAALTWLYTLIGLQALPEGLGYFFGLDKKVRPVVADGHRIPRRALLAGLIALSFLGLSAGGRMLELDVPVVTPSTVAALVERGYRVVAFDALPTKFVFWRGTGYIPMMVNEEGQWYSNEFNETWWGDVASRCPTSGWSTAAWISSRRARHGWW